MSGGEAVIDQSIFDEGVERRGTMSLKWDDLGRAFGRADVLPLWVADMDFRAPEPVVMALAARVSHGAFGYPMEDPGEKLAVARWMARRHGAQIEPESVLFSPGVVDSQRIAVSALSSPGDLVAVQPPVYGPFYASARADGRAIYRNPLLLDADGWHMDLEGLEAGLQQGVRLLLLCNPHNPVGRAWTRAELGALCDLCARYGVVIISDEIHGDLVLPGHHHTSLACLDPNAVVLISATKTFNLAALRHSSVIIQNERTREAFRREYEARGIDGINLFGALAQKVAYERCEPWLDALLAYLDETRRQAESFIAREMPWMRAARLEGTYLMWLDLRALSKDDEALERMLVDRAGVGLSSGRHFGPEGAGFMRMNLATPRRNVLRALESIRRACADGPA